MKYPLVPSLFGDFANRRGTILGKVCTINPKSRNRTQTGSFVHRRVGRCVFVSAFMDRSLEEMSMEERIAHYRALAEDALELSQNSATEEQRMRSEEHTSELQSHSFISYAVF